MEEERGRGAGRGEAGSLISAHHVQLSYVAGSPLQWGGRGVMTHMAVALA